MKQPAPKSVKHLNEEEQKLSDEATVFDLAACMMDVYTFSFTKQKQGLINTMARVGQILRHDPTFALRFKQAIAAVEAIRTEARQKAQAEQSPPSPIVTP